MEKKRQSKHASSKPKTVKGRKKKHASSKPKTVHVHHHHHRARKGEETKTG
jgi:hypothetical protein